MESNIGFYRYENKNITNYEMPYYPINLNVLRNIKHLKYEFENNTPKKIDGKFVVLI
jgi:hypothetical protein